MAEVAEANEAQAEGNKPILLADNGHGTKVKLWTNNGKHGQFQTISIERSYRTGEGFDTQRVTLNPSDIKTVIEGLKCGKEQIVDTRHREQGH